MIISHHTLTQMRCKIMLTVLETDHISIQASPSVVAWRSESVFSVHEPVSETFVFMMVIIWCRDGHHMMSWWSSYDIMAVIWSPYDCHMIIMRQKWLPVYTIQMYKSLLNHWKNNKHWNKNHQNIIFTLDNFYRTQVNLGSDLWVRMSVTNKLLDVV